MEQTGYVDVVKFEGEIKKIFFTKDEYIIGQFQTDTDKERFNFKGNFYGIEENEKLIIYGKWVQHSKYGNQLEVTQWERPIPTTEENIVSFLSSGLIKGVGKARAKRIVNTLGSNAINIIKNDGIKSLEGIKGIAHKTAEGIVESVRNTFEVQEIVKALARFGISANVCMKLYKLHGSNTVKLINQNPYLLTEVDHIGFLKADNIAKQMGINPTSSFRLRSCIIYVLNKLCNQGGHTYINQDALINETLKVLNADTCEMQYIVHKDELEQVLYDLEEKLVMFEGSKVYNKRTYTYETYIARKISILKSAWGGEALPKIKRQLKNYQSKNSIILAKKQREAVYKLMSENVMILTGKPGTGKTTTLKAMIDVYKSLNPKSEVLLSAPTGRASRKMQESTGYKAVTVHRMLGYQQGSIPDYNEDNQLEADLVIVDEWSMADLNLTYWLLSALKRGTKILFIGDTDQLPSVSPGNVLNDLIKAELPTVKLDEIFRQAKDSQIIQNSHRIKNGEYLVIDDSKEDFYFIQQYNNSKVANLIIKSALRFMELGYDLEDILILSPMNMGEVGVETLNEMLRGAINPKSPLKNEISIGNSKLFREGDKVMQNINNQDKGVYNGDLGIVKSIQSNVKDKDGKAQDMIICDFEGVEVEYNRKELIELELGFCMTIHKSQGGEAPIVIMPIVMSHEKMLVRNLYYTAVTRAKNKVVLIGTYEAMNVAIKNNKVAERNSILDQRIMFEIYQIERFVQEN